MIDPNTRRDLEEIAAGRSPVGDGLVALARTVLSLVECVESMEDRLWHWAYDKTATTAALGAPKPTPDDAPDNLIGAPEAPEGEQP